MEVDVMLHLPMDIIDKILSHLSDPASLARLASTCKFWHNQIKDKAFLNRLKKRRHNHGFTPSLLLGFFYQESTESSPHLSQRHRDKRSCLAPRFMPISELSQFIGSKDGCKASTPVSIGTFIQGLGAKLNFYEPVASQDGFLALRHHPVDGQSQREELYVCNPLTGEIFHIPPLLPPFPPLDQYALLVTEAVSHSGHTSQSFQLVAIWIREGRLISGTYCSKHKGWKWYGASPDLPGPYVMSSPAAVSRCAIHFLYGVRKNWTLTHVTTLHIDTKELSYMDIPPDAKRSKALATSADGELLLLYLKGLQMSLWKHDSNTSYWILSGTINLSSSLPLRMVQMQVGAKVILETFQGKSGTAVLWVEGEGRFLLSFSDGSIRKIDNEHVTKKYFLCPYEIDWLTCLAMMNLVVDGSLSQDAARETVQARWRTLMMTGKAYE